MSSPMTAYDPDEDASVGSVGMGGGPAPAAPAAAHNDATAAARLAGAALSEAGLADRFLSAPLGPLAAGRTMAWKTAGGRKQQGNTASTSGCLILRWLCRASRRAGPVVQGDLPAVNDSWAQAWVSHTHLHVHALGTIPLAWLAWSCDLRDHIGNTNSRSRVTRTCVHARTCTRVSTHLFGGRGAHV